MGASIGAWVRKRGLVVEILAPSAPGICCQPARSVLSLVSSGRGGMPLEVLAITMSGLS